MEATVLEFHLEYNPNRKNPAEVFHAMGDFISAYQEMGQIIAQAVDSEMNFDVELQEVTHGCILAKLLLKVEEWTRPDDLFRELTGEMSQKEQVQHVTNKERDRLKSEMSKRNRASRFDPYISDFEVALVLRNGQKEIESCKLTSISKFVMKVLIYQMLSLLTLALDSPEMSKRCSQMNEGTLMVKKWLRS